MPLPPIENTSPEVEPAVAERNYDAMYMTLLVTRLLNDGTQNMRLGFRPYDSAADVVKDDGDVVVEVEDIFVRSVTMPAFAEAMVHVVRVGNLLCKERQLQQKLDAMEDDDEDRPVTQTELDNLQSYMQTATLADLSS